jgi:hypothetical protein
MRATKPIVLTVALLVAAGCSSQAVQPANAPASTDSCRGSGCSLTYETPSATADAAPSAQVGQTVTKGGITLTVKDARGVETIQMNESNFRPGSGYEKYTKTTPKEGGRFVMVTTHVVNNAKVSLDLTCSLPLMTKLIDAQQRNFDAIDDLYKLKGNPECNDQLQPGFEADMTWVYLVPKTATVVGWGFRDTTDLSGVGDYSTVRFDA